MQDSSSDEEVEAEVKEEKEDSDDELDLLGNTAHSAQEASWPSNWHAAMKRSDADEWRQAAQEEIDAHIANGTWEPCSLPPGKKAIGSRWVFLQKFLSNGDLERYKARLVAKGYAQKPGFD